MAARLPRRTFSNPFVVTLAAIPACVSSTAPPPTTVQPEPVQVSPAPVAEPTAGTQPATPPPAAPPVVVANPPRPVDPPAPEPAATYDQHWRVTKSGDTCLAMADVKCPTAAPGMPRPTCNPPPPIKYACPDGFTDGQPMTIVLRAGETECKVDFGPMKCPPKAMCNPPRPRVVACPKR
jgi:hypothetical protein